jgi:PAS domain S-box-containing protein
MSSEIRILHLEDDPADADLVQVRLQVEGLQCRIVRVSTRTDFERELGQQPFDVVFADYRLPSYDGVSALQYATRVCPDIPFIMISGTLGEDAANECLTRGAKDYVTKQKLTRLVPVTRRALEEAENLRARRKAEEAIQKLSHVVEQSPVSVVVTDTEGTIEYVNPKFTEVTGYAREEVLGKNPRILKSGEMPTQVYTDLWNTLLSGNDWRGELCNKRKDGSIYWELAVISPMVDKEGRTTNYIAVKEDITARKHMEDSIRASLHEKEILLKEVHHRVKNNLQIISSLMELQAGKHEGQTVREAFDVSQRRVRTMALVHEQLYASGNLARIDFGHHLAQIARELCAAYARIEVELDISVDPIQLPVDLAIPCGLIANELLTNALKHAFVDRERGVITIRLQHTDPEHAVMLIADDGVGFVVNSKHHDGGTLGMRLVTTLVDQIMGELNVDTSKGSSFRLSIPLTQ